MENLIQEQVTELLGNYGWMFLGGAVILLFRQTIENAVDGFMVFFGNDYNEDDVVEIDGKPGRIVRVGIWKTVFFTYDIRDGKCLSLKTIKTLTYPIREKNNFLEIKIT